MLLDTFNFSQLMNALLLYDKKQLTIAQLVSLCYLFCFARFV